MCIRDSDWPSEVQLNGDRDKLYWINKAIWSMDVTASHVPVDVYKRQVWVCNTTYTYLVMKDGNSFTQGSLSAQKGWFKVVFVALDADVYKRQVV